MAINAAKVLFLQSLGADYGAYMLERGFVELLGADRVREWPYKRTHNGGIDHYPERCNPAPGHQSEVIHVGADGKIGYVESFTGCELWNHPALWRAWKPEKLPSAYVPSDAPVHFMTPLGVPEASDDEILSMVQRGEFGLILLNGPRWHGTAALSELRATFGDDLPPIVFVDHEDYPQRRWDVLDAFKPVAYFKRSLLTMGHPCDFIFGRRPEVIVKPLPFSVVWDVPWVPWADREFDVACLFGATQVARGRLLETTKAVVEKVGCRGIFNLGHVHYSSYMRTLAHSKIIIDQQSYGTDTVRFWEAGASGCCLISDHCLVSPPPAVVPGHHFFQYDNDLSPTGAEQDFTRFEEMLVRAVRDDAETEAMARRMYEHVRGHHRAVDRAAYVLSELRAAWVALPGLL